MDRQQLLNDNEASLRLALDGRQSNIWTAIPCIVQSVDFAAMTIEAQPAIQGTVLLEDGSSQSVNLPLLVDVPIVFPSAGGFMLTLPIRQGDEVLVVFASRCIDAWWQSGGVQRPMEARMHDLSDGFAIPGPRSVPNVVTGISQTTAQLRSDDGTVYLEIDDDGEINIVATNVNIGENPTHGAGLGDVIEARLSAVESALSDFITDYNLHMHPTAAVGPPSAPSTPEPPFVPDTTPVESVTVTVSA